MIRIIDTEVSFMALEEVQSKSAFNGIHKNRDSQASGPDSDRQSSLSAKLKLQEVELRK